MSGTVIRLKRTGRTADSRGMSSTTSAQQLALPLPETLDDILAEWRRYGVAAGHSTRTIASRAGTIRLLAAAGIDPLTVTRQELIDWLADLPLARSSRATYRTHLRAWTAWLVDTGRRIDDPGARLPSTRAPRGVPHPVTAAEVRAALEACTHPGAARTRAYILLGAYAGLRVHEIAKIRGEDVRGDLHVVGKGGVASTVPMSPVIRQLAETMPSTGFWFPSISSTGHVHRSTVSAAIQRAFKRAGVRAVPHALRHFYCTEILRATGGDLRTTQRAARHASPATTAVYTLVADETLMSAVCAIPGAA